MAKLPHCMQHPDHVLLFNKRLTLELGSLVFPFPADETGPLYRGLMTSSSSSAAVASLRPVVPNMNATESTVSSSFNSRGEGTECCFCGDRCCGGAVGKRSLRGLSGGFIWTKGGWGDREYCAGSDGGRMLPLRGGAAYTPAEDCKALGGDWRRAIGPLLLPGIGKGLRAPRRADRGT